VADGRFAPSPSGPLHLGNIRTALLAWLFVRSSGGRYLVRVEDLDDRARNAEFERSQLTDLAALGLDADDPPVRQSERLDLYHDAIATLVATGLTYECTCTRREIREAATAQHGEAPEGAYPGTCRTLSAAERARRAADGRPAALRLHTEIDRLAIDDRLHGRYVGAVDDVVLRRNDGVPAYNLAVVVDDAAQGIDEVVRGDDLLPSTPRQAHLCDLLGLDRPVWAHVPLVFGPDGERMSKRHGSVTLDDQRAAGRSPSQVVGELGAGLGLCEAGASVEPVELLSAFDAARLSLEPWVAPPVLVNDGRVDP
jgi:glutamyl-tRNA synthetase